MFAPFEESPVSFFSYVSTELGCKAEDYCGNCLMPVTRSPVKRTNTVFDGGWP